MQAEVEVVVEGDFDDGGFYENLRGRLVEAQITWTGPWSMQGRFVRDVSPLPDKLQAPLQTITFGM